MEIKFVALSDLVAFGIPRPQKWAKDPKIKTLVKSIARDGLLNPLKIKAHKNKYLVVDGTKRLKALILLARSSRFHKPSQKVSCITEEESLEKPNMLKRPALMSAPELVHFILGALDEGQSSVAIAQRFRCDLSIVDSAHAIQNLHSKVLQSFYNGTIGLEQAIAFASLPNPNAQWALLQQLGPFVSDKNVIRALQSGESVIETPDETMIFLPSREKRNVKQVYKRSRQLANAVDQHDFKVAA